MAKYEEKKVGKPLEKKIYKIHLQIHPDGTSTITRPNLPMIMDKTDNAISWIKYNGFKVEDIEVVGEKPVYWNDIFFETTTPLAVAVENALVS